MNQTELYSLTLDLILRLREAGSWCGETHLQKSMYFLEELLEIPSEYGFILYKHGPFSFEFRDIINDLRARNLIEHKHIPPYGPQLVLTQAGEKFHKANEARIEAWAQHIAATAKCLGRKGVVDLEKLATALMVSKEGLTDANERATRLHELKPHVLMDEALSAVNEYDSIAACLKTHACATQ